MSDTLKDFDFWDEDVPVIILYSDKEFDYWLDGMPVVDQGAPAQTTAKRRRVYEF